MGYILSTEGFDKLIRNLSEDYRVFAPVLLEGTGRFFGTDVVRYQYVTDAASIDLEHRSDYSYKDVLLPISKTLFYFTEDHVTEPKMDERKILVFLRACDLHALKRFDAMFLQNGSQADWFYDQVRERLTFALIGCPHSFEDCFCVSMGANEAKDGWAFSVEVSASDSEPDETLIRSALADPSFAKYFEGGTLRVEDVVPSHVSADSEEVHVPDEVPEEIITSDLWNEYNARCIACGRCTLVCPTCTCWTMEDISYSDNGKVGERRRVQASCMIDGYTNAAGGIMYRGSKAERMRFKVLHKISDFKKRFGYNMCVGCGRCDAVCPEYISFSSCINKVSDAVVALNQKKEDAKS